MELASDEMAEAPIVVQPVSLEDFVQRRPPKLSFPLEQTTLEPKLSQWLACEMQDAQSDGLDLGGRVNNLRAICEWLLQDAQSDGLDCTYMIIALAWWQWTHTGNFSARTLSTRS